MVCNEAWTKSPYPYLTISSILYFLGTLSFLVGTGNAQQWDASTKVYSWTGYWEEGPRGELIEVPSDIPAQAVEVDLVLNQIEVIKENSFSHLSKCEELNLWSNKIHTIEVGAWYGLVSLKTLFLSRNEIKVLKKDSFSHLSVCETLRVLNNKIHTIESGAWNGLVSLKTLFLNSNEIKVLKKDSFNYLSACEHLDFTYNKIHTIESETWNGLSSLRELDLRGNQFEVIRENSFSHLSVCETLDLSDNKIHTIESGAWYGLISLKHLRLDNNEIKELKKDSFSHLSACKALGLWRNKIRTIESEALNGLGSLTYLGLHDNKLTVLTRQTFSGLVQLLELELQDNELKRIEPLTFDTTVMKDLRELYLHRNHLSTLSWTVFGKEHPSNLKLALSGNQLVCNSSLCWIKQGVLPGWIALGIMPRCSDTNIDWDDVTLDCTHLGAYQIQSIHVHSFKFLF